MAEPNSNSACSLYRVDEGEKHVLIFPEEEKPKTLNRHFWGDAFEGTMEPATDFVGILLAIPSDGTKHRYKGLLEFAWRYYGHAIKPPRSADELYRLSLEYGKYLLEREPDGYLGFTNGAQWHPSLGAYKPLEHSYEIGWVGQNASFASAFIYDYLKNGNKDSLDVGVSVLDSWLKNLNFEKGFIPAHVNYPTSKSPSDIPWHTMTREDVDPMEWGEAQLEGILGRVGKPKPQNKVAVAHDACNLGTGAEGFFEAYDLLLSAGICCNIFLLKMPV